MRLRERIVWLAVLGLTVLWIRWLRLRPSFLDRDASSEGSGADCDESATWDGGGTGPDGDVPRPLRRTRAGIIYLRITNAKEARRAGTSEWPQWLPVLEASAASNAADVTYYFAGPSANFSCGNCVSIPTDLSSLLDRVERHLGVSRSEIAVKSLKHKICDLKPMWPALFPEVAAAHDFVGYADMDVIFGDLGSEVRGMRDEDDVLVPSSWRAPGAPHPPARSPSRAPTR